MTRPTTRKTLFPTDQQAVREALRRHATAAGLPNLSKIAASDLEAVCEVGKATAQKLLRGGEVSVSKIMQVASILNVPDEKLVCSTCRDEYEALFCQSTNNTLHAPQTEIEGSSFAESSQVTVNLPTCCNEEYFVRSHDVDTLKELMNTSGDPEAAADIQFLTSIQGFPGIGKSEIAVRLAQDPDVLRTFSDGAHWFECEHNHGSETQNKIACGNLLSQINEQLTGESLQHLPLVSQAKTAVKKSLRDKSALLIIDDAWDRQLMSILKEVVPSHCGILVTTSQPASFDERVDERVKVYDVPEMSLENARQLIHATFSVANETKPENATTETLIRESAFLPATTIIAARTLIFLRRRGFTDQAAIGEITSAVRNQPMPRLQMQSNARSIRQLLTATLNVLSPVSLQALGKLQLLAVPFPTVTETDLSSIWGDHWELRVLELCDVGLLRIIFKGGDRLFRINRFVYDLAEQIS